MVTDPKPLTPAEAALAAGESDWLITNEALVKAVADLAAERAKVKLWQDAATTLVVSIESRGGWSTYAKAPFRTLSKLVDAARTGEGVT